MYHSSSFFYFLRLFVSRSSSLIDSWGFTSQNHHMIRRDAIVECSGNFDRLGFFNVHPKLSTRAYNITASIGNGAATAEIWSRDNLEVYIARYAHTNDASHSIRGLMEHFQAILALCLPCFCDNFIHLWKYILFFFSVEKDAVYVFIRELIK